MSDVDLLLLLTVFDFYLSSSKSVALNNVLLLLILSTDMLYVLIFPFVADVLFLPFSLVS